MRLSCLAEAAERVEATSSRDRRVALLAELLQHAAAAERATVVYLLQGRLRPPFDGVELGLGETLLATAVAEAYGAARTEVVRRLRASGDLGYVAGAMAPPGPTRSRLTVRRAHAELLAIARIGGAGSVRRRISRFAALLRAADGREARLLVRVAQGRLRLGLGDQTILEAAALAALGDRRRKPLLERAYNVRSDLGAIVRLAFAGGGRALAALGPRPGVPVRPALAQRLPTTAAIIARLGEVQAEPKYDGFRLQLHRDGNRVWMFSRRSEDVTHMFPELVEGMRRQLRARRAIVEGEAIVYDRLTGTFLPFQVTMTRKRKTGVAETAALHPLRLIAFDLLYADGRSYLAHPQSERSARLRELLPFAPDSPVTVTETLVTRRADELERYFRAMTSRGLEGIVAKRPDLPYEAGARGYAWVKLKRAYGSALRDTVDLVLVGYMRGRGKRAALGIGSLLGAVYDPAHDRFRTVAKVGSGLTDAGWRELRPLLDSNASRERPAGVDSLIQPDVWVEPRHVMEVLADEITRSPLHTCGKVGDAAGYALRFPRLVDGVRADRAAADATTEAEILELYRLQRSAPGPPSIAGRARAAGRRAAPRTHGSSS